MEFGKVDHPENIDFILPKDHPNTKKILNANRSDRPFMVYVGCAKWNKKDLKGFYPSGTKDELIYYSSQFNSVELNATFYKAPSISQVQIWRDKVPEEFRFYPKIPREISHSGPLLNKGDRLTTFCDAISNFENTLGIPFLQLHDNFKPKDFGRLQGFVKEFPKGMPLAIEVRNKEWFLGGIAGDDFFNLLLKDEKIAILVDTAGRRDVLHMRLTSPHAFIRYVGANHPSDYTRLDDWVERLKLWRKEGLQSLHFFVHQNVEEESPLLSAHFIQKMNKEFDLHLKVPIMGK